MHLSLFRLSLTAILAIAAATLLSASPYQISFKGSFYQSDVPGAINVGDKFLVTFDLDPSATDASADPTLATFANAVSNLTFALESGAAGTYSGGGPTAPHILWVADEEALGYDSVRYFIGGFPIPPHNFTDAGVHPFTMFAFELRSGVGAFDLTQNFEPIDPIIAALDIGNFGLLARVELAFDFHASYARANISSIIVKAPGSPPPSSVPDTVGGSMTLIAIPLLLMILTGRRHHARRT